MLIGFYSISIYGLFNDVLSSSPELLITEINLYHFLHNLRANPLHIPACAKFTGCVCVYS
jgi:hypothetical protein